MEQCGRTYRTPTVVRIWHWVNALAVVTLCLTGAQIRFPEYLDIFGSYKGAIRLHDTAGLVSTGSFALWLVYYGVIARTLNRTYLPSWDDVRHGVGRQARYYFFDYFLGRSHPPPIGPPERFNPLQKAAYAVIMLVLAPLVCITGLLLLNVQPMRAWITAAGGIKILDGVHFLAACCLCAFLFTHAYLATLGPAPLSRFKEMWTGWTEEGAEPFGSDGGAADPRVGAPGEKPPSGSADSVPEGGPGGRPVPRGGGP